MRIVIPMAGHGARFASAGYDVPKPLIDVVGKPMYAWATESLPLERARALIFICRESHLDARGLRADIQRRFAAWQPTIIPVSEPTEGQAATLLLARALIDDDEPLLIYNADTLSRGPFELPPDSDGALGLFEAAGDHWSFARLDDEGFVSETAEKVRISPWASSGLYFFRRGRDFVHHADDMIRANERVRGEYYVAPIYNRMLRAGARIVALRHDEVWPLGTPEELSRFLSDPRAPRGKAP